MHRRKQGLKEQNRQGRKGETKQFSEATPLVTFAILSVRLIVATDTNFLVRIANSAHSRSEKQELSKQAELFSRERWTALAA